MGMKLKSGADLCGFQLTNFCVQGEASAPSDAALGRKYFHTNATDDVATGISLLNRERIYLGEGAWRATAYLDDIAAINEKLNLITGDTDTDTLINNLKDLEEFLKDFSETDKLKSLLDGKLDKTGGTIDTIDTYGLNINSASDSSGILFKVNNDNRGMLLSGGTWGTAIVNPKANYNAIGILDTSEGGYAYFSDFTAGKKYALIHSGNIGSQTVAAANILRTTTGIPYVYAYNTDKIFVFGESAAANGYKTYVDGISISLRYGSSTATGLILNSSGNVTIGGSDLAGTSAKLYVNNNTEGSTALGLHVSSVSSYTQALGSRAGWAACIGRPTYGLLIGSNSSDGSSLLQVGRLDNTDPHNMALQPLGGNVLIGTTTDSGYKLDVLTDDFTGLRLTRNKGEGYGQSIIFQNKSTILGTLGWRMEDNFFIANKTNDATSNQLIMKGSHTDLTVYPNVHIKGNLIVDGEVSAGGAGAEGGTSGSGSAEGVSEIFTPTSTSMAFDHNLGEDVIVQVYEKSGNVWNMVMVDTEITSATRVTLRFGKTETTQHKVVIMGV